MAAVLCWPGMSRNAVWAGSKEAEAPVKPALEVLLLYEDLATALRAKKSLDGLPGQPAATTGFQARLWRLDLLAEPLLAEQAALEAAAADIIILSLHGRTELRAEVRNWLSRWLEHKEHRPYAIAALLDAKTGSSRSDNTVLAYLKEVARDAGADLLCGFLEASV